MSNVTIRLLGMHTIGFIRNPHNLNDITKAAKKKKSFLPAFRLLLFNIINYSQAAAYACNTMTIRKSGRKRKR